MRHERFRKKAFLRRTECYRWGLESTGHRATRDYAISTQIPVAGGADTRGDRSLCLVRRHVSRSAKALDHVRTYAGIHDSNVDEYPVSASSGALLWSHMHP